jgi:hypothetical protein
MRIISLELNFSRALSRSRLLRTKTPAAYLLLVTLGIFNNSATDRDLKSTLLCFSPVFEAIWSHCIYSRNQMKFLLFAVKCGFFLIWHEMPQRRQWKSFNPRVIIPIFIFFFGLPIHRIWIWLKLRWIKWMIGFGIIVRKMLYLMIGRFWQGPS